MRLVYIAAGIPDGSGAEQVKQMQSLKDKNILLFDPAV